VTVRARRASGDPISFQVLVRIDTPQEVLYYRHGGILPFVLRQLLGGRDRPVALAAVPASAAPPAPGAAAADRAVDEGSKESFPASDPPAY
jgi:aconitate hydratase